MIIEPRMPKRDARLKRNHHTKKYRRKVIELIFHDDTKLLMKCFDYEFYEKDKECYLEIGKTGEDEKDLSIATNVKEVNEIN